MSQKNNKSVTHLISHLRDLEKTLLDLELEGDQFVQDMESLEQDLDIPERLIVNLKTLDESLDTLDEILDIIIVIPQITIGGRELKKAIDIIKKPVHKASVVSSDCDPLMKDVLSAVAKFKVKIQQLDQDMEVKRDKIVHFNTVVNQTEQCISQLKAGDTREEQSHEMIQAAIKVDKQVNNANKLLLLVDDSLDRINKEVEQITNKLKVLKEISQPIEASISELNLITKPLKPVKKALSQTISVPYEKSTKYCKKWGIPYPCGWHVVHASFTVEQILGGLSGMVKPVEGLLKKETNAVLNPLIKSLDFKAKFSSIPGLDSLSTKLQALFSNFISLPNEVDELLNKAEQLEQEIDAIQELRRHWLRLQDDCQKMNL